MKTCPICNAVAFDDAEVCFGCLYNFKEGTAKQGAAPPAPADAGETKTEKPSRVRRPKVDDELPLARAFDEGPMFSDPVEVPFDYVPVDAETISEIEQNRSDGNNSIAPANSMTGTTATESDKGQRVCARSLGTLPITFQISLTPTFDERGALGWNCAFTLSPCGHADSKARQPAP